MKKAMVAMICVLLALALGIIGFLGVMIMGGGPDMGFSISAVAELANRVEFSAEDLQEIEIAYSSDSVTILPATGDKVILEEYMSRSDEGMYAVCTNEGGRLSIRQGERPIVVFGINVSYAKLYLPRGYTGALRAETKSGSLKCEMDLTLESLQAVSSSGSVRMQVVETKGDVRASSKSGSVHFERIKAGGEVDFSSSSGSVKGEEIVAGGNVSLTASSGSVKPGDVTGNIIRAESNSGSIRFGHVECAQITASCSSGGVSAESLHGEFNLQSKSGSVQIENGRGFGRATSSSGSVKISLVEVSGDLTLESTSGTVRLDLPYDTAVDFYARTNSGSIHTPFDDALSYSGGGEEARGVYGSGTPCRVSCTTSSGSIKLEWR